MTLRLLRVVLVALCMAAPCAAEIISGFSSQDPTGTSDQPDMSGSGRFVVFRSVGSGLTGGNGSESAGIFLTDRDTAEDGDFTGNDRRIDLISRRGALNANGESREPRITSDGRFIVFVSLATNLVVGPSLSTGVARVFRADRLTGEIVLVSIGSNGAPAGADCSSPQVSDDGQVVVFLSTASDLAPGPHGASNAIFLRDLATGTTRRLSAPQAPPLQSGSVQVAYTAASPALSGDGRVVAWSEIATRRDDGSLAGIDGQVSVFDAQTGLTRRNVGRGHRVLLSRDGAFAVVHNPVGPGLMALAYRLHLATGDRLISTIPIAVPSDITADAASVATVTGDLYSFDFARSSFREGPALMLATSDRHFAFVGYWTVNNVVTATIVYANNYDRQDLDRDALDDRWESFFRFNRLDATGDNGPGGDPDGDGLTNAEEQAAGTHPRGAFQRFLAEGASNAFFRTRLSVLNPDPSADAAVVVRFEKSDGSVSTQPVQVFRGRRATLEVSAARSLGTGDFSMMIESDLPVVVDRLMSWDGTRYGTHAETASGTPSAAWFLAEGSTVLGFQLFYLLQNPQSTATTATVRYLRSTGAPVVRTYELPARSRTTIYVNEVPQLGATDVSGEVTATQPIMVERAMYRNRGQETFALGHAASAIAAAATDWFLAEGATGSFFDTYVLVANPSPADAQVQVDFLRDDGGVVSRGYTVRANSRFSVFADAVPGLEATSFGARVTSTVPVVVERAMYWPGGFFEYYEGHVSAATRATGSEWILAEGEVGGADGAETYVLIANTADVPVSVRLEPLADFAFPPSTPAVSRVVSVPANGRASVTLRSMLAPGTDLSVPVRLGVRVEETSETQTAALVVEGALYTSAGGVVWSAGASWPATRIR